MARPRLLHIPDAVGAPASELIRRLLTGAVPKRLGCGAGGGAELEAHAFFGGIDFDGLLRRALPPPMLPPLEPICCAFDAADEACWLCDGGSAKSSGSEVETGTGSTADDDVA
eukprot:256831-Prymnesium_polylepis.2